MAQAFQDHLPTWAQALLGWAIVAGFYLSVISAWIAGGRDD